MELFPEGGSRTLVGLAGRALVTAGALWSLGFRLARWTFEDPGGVHARVLVLSQDGERMAGLVWWSPAPCLQPRGSDASPGLCGPGLFGFVCLIDTQHTGCYAGTVNTDSAASPRLAFRMKPELKERIEQAAAVMGLTLTDFVVSTLAQRASEVLERESRITLNDQERDRFLAALNRPGRPLPQLQETLARNRSDS